MKNRKKAVYTIIVTNKTDKIVKDIEILDAANNIQSRLSLPVEIDYDSPSLTYLEFLSCLLLSVFYINKIELECLILENNRALSMDNLINHITIRQKNIDGYSVSGNYIAEYDKLSTESKVYRRIVTIDKLTSITLGKIQPNTCIKIKLFKMSRFEVFIAKIIIRIQMIKKVFLNIDNNLFI